MRLVMDENYRFGECGTRKLRWDLISKALCRWSADGHTVRQRYSLLEHWTGARPASRCTHCLEHGYSCSAQSHRACVGVQLKSSTWSVRTRRSKCSPVRAGSNNTKVKTWAGAAGAAAPARAAAPGAATALAAAPQPAPRDPRAGTAAQAAAAAAGSWGAAPGQAAAPMGRAGPAGAAAAPAGDTAARWAALKKHGGIPYKLLAVTAMLARAGCEGTALQARPCGLLWLASLFRAAAVAVLHGVCRFACACGYQGVLLSSAG